MHHQARAANGAAGIVVDHDLVGIVDAPVAQPGRECFGTRQRMAPTGAGGRREVEVEVGVDGARDVSSA
jgi:hypothetical protein